MSEFKVGDRVRYVPREGDVFAYTVTPDNTARVAEVQSPEANPYYIQIQFSYVPTMYPVKPEELIHIDKEGNVIE